MRAKDKALAKGDLNPSRGSGPPPPIRKKGFAEMVPSGMPGPKDAQRGSEKQDKGERIKPKTYQDYNQWDKFVHKDLDKMLSDFDEQERQEMEEEHRLRLADERRRIEEKEAAARKHIGPSAPPLPPVRRRRASRAPRRARAGTFLPRPIRVESRVASLRSGA